MMSRFCRYVDKVFDLSTLVETLRDGRPQPQISTRTVWYSAFEMFATHRRSLNAWECVARPAKRPRNGAGRGPPSADTIGEVFACLDSGPLREMLKRILLWRAAHSRWDIENDDFNALGMHWALNHCSKHDPQAILNFVLTLFVVFVLLQSFYRRNLKPARRVFGLAEAWDPLPPRGVPGTCQSQRI